MFIKYNCLYNFVYLKFLIFVYIYVLYKYYFNTFKYKFNIQTPFQPHVNMLHVHSTCQLNKAISIHIINTHI